MRVAVIGATGHLGSVVASAAGEHWGTPRRGRRPT